MHFRRGFASHVSRCLMRTKTGITDQVFVVCSSSRARDIRGIETLLSLLGLGEVVLKFGKVSDVWSTGATKSTGFVLLLPPMTARSSTSRYAVYIMLCR